MDRLRKPRCNTIEYKAELFGVVLRQLDYVGVDFRVLVAIARKLIVGKFGEPVGEGWVCEDEPVWEDIEYFCKYMMVYSCVEEGVEKLIKVVIEKDYEDGFKIWSWIHDKLPIYEYGEPIPVKLGIEVVEKRDDMSNKFAEIVRPYGAKDE